MPLSPCPSVVSASYHISLWKFCMTNNMVSVEIEFRTQHERNFHYDFLPILRCHDRCFGPIGRGGPSTRSYPRSSIYKVGQREWVLGCVNFASCRADTSSVCVEPITFPVPFISRPMNHRREIRSAELSKNGTPHARPRCVNVLLMMIRAPDPTAEQLLFWRLTVKCREVCKFSTVCR